MATSLSAGSVLWRRFVPLVGWASVCGALLSAGCSRGAWQGVDIAGSVQAGGALIGKGSISFLPARGRTGPSVTAVIENGRYHVSSADGPAPGPHTVLVYLEVDQKRAVMAGAPAPAAPTKTRWETSVEIPATGHFDCDLKLD